VSAQLEKEMISLEMDREVIRCKTCDLSNTGRAREIAGDACAPCLSVWSS